MTLSPCPNCGSTDLYRSRKDVSAGGSHGPNFLPGLGPWYSAAKASVVMCRDCGLTRLFASQQARDRVSTSAKWTSAR